MKPYLVCGLFLSLLGAVFAKNHIVEVDLAKQESPQGSTTLAPGKFAEVCFLLKQNQSIAWQFEANSALAFNIHYHQGKEVVTPVQKDLTRQEAGELKAALSIDYCLMWQAPKTAKDSIALKWSLKRL